MKNVVLILTVVIGVFFVSCKSNSGDKFVGIWEKQDGSRIEISTAGESAYTFKAIGPRSYGVAFSHTKTVTYEDGNLVSGGTVLCSYSDNKIIFKGDEYVKVN